MSTLHPAASLYEDVTDDVKVKQCFNNLKSILKEKNIELITVRSALKLNKTALKKLASDALIYHYDDEEARKYEKCENKEGIKECQFCKKYLCEECNKKHLTIEHIVNNQIVKEIEENKYLKNIDENVLLTVQQEKKKTIKKK